MAQVVSQPSAIDMTYVPPPLPTFLADTHPLKPIIGVPVDEEMEAIHATIRAMNGVSHLPTLYDLNLSIRLAQHLFDTQMAVYRSKYPFGIFPADITYTPPSLPSFITETLEPVVGPPSDEQLESVYSAVRAMDGLTNFPSMFDPKLSMKLSQHLFDIQLARHIQHSSQGQFSPKPKPTQARAEVPETQTTSNATEIPSMTLNVRNDESELVRPNEQSLGATIDYIRGSKTAPDETSGLLSEIGDTLKTISRVLISSQNSSVWSIQSSEYPHPLLNKKGELPSKYSLPRLYRKWGSNGYAYFVAASGGGNLTDRQLAGYLKFYDIGIDLIENGETPTIKAGKRQEVEKMLYQHIWEGPGPS